MPLHWSWSWGQQSVSPRCACYSMGGVLHDNGSPWSSWFGPVIMELQSTSKLGQSEWIPSILNLLYLGYSFYLVNGCLVGEETQILLVPPTWTRAKVPHIRTFKLWTFKDANVHPHVQSRKLLHVSGIQCHVRASSTRGCAFVYFTVQDCIVYSSTVSFFQAQDVLKQA